MLLPGEQGFEIQGQENQRPEVDLSSLTTEPARSRAGHSKHWGQTGVEANVP